MDALKAIFTYPVRLFIVFIAFLTLFSCQKDEEEEHQYVVKYEFTSDVADNYRFEYRPDNTGNSVAIEPGLSNSWSKTVTMTKNMGFATPTIAAFLVFPPSSWNNTSKTANVTLKIFINGIISEEVTVKLTGSNLSNGVVAIASI